MHKFSPRDPDTRSVDMIAENVARLRVLFPEAVTDGKIDFDVLKQLLGGATEERDEKYGLNWHGKRRARQLAMTPSAATLRPAINESVDWENSRNIVIEGDNLEVLKLLQKTYAGKVKMITIDPPYNTGKDFVYPDTFQDTLRNYLELTGHADAAGRRASANPETSGRFHTAWLNMIYPRLKLARNLLRDDGVIFISIDDTEFAGLRKLCDEIFGEENFIGEIVWRTATDNNATQIAIEHEYILCFARNKNAQSDWSVPSNKAKYIIDKYTELKSRHGSDIDKITTELRAWINASVQNNDPDIFGVAHYSYVDTQGVYYPGNSSNTKPGGYNFDILHPVTQKACARPANGYRWPRETFDRAAADGEVHWGEDHASVPRLKKRVETATELLKSTYYEDNRISTAQLTALMGAKVFDNPKSVRLIQMLTQFTTRDDDKVLDFFAGSGTTGHAVMAQNIADGGQRRFILVQLPEALDPIAKEQRTAAEYCRQIGRPLSIAELTKERLRRAGNKLKLKHPNAICDTGFRVFKLDSSNIREWEPDGDNLAQSLVDAIDPIKPGRSDQDILFEFMLKLGFDLTAPIAARIIVGKTVYNIGTGDLMVCLADWIEMADVQPLAMELIEWRKEFAANGETQAVFRDRAFVNDVAKINLTTILERHGVGKVRSI